MWHNSMWMFVVLHKFSNNFSCDYFELRIFIERCTYRNCVNGCIVYDLDFDPVWFSLVSFRYIMITQLIYLIASTFIPIISRSATFSIRSRSSVSWITTFVFVVSSFTWFFFSTLLSFATAVSLFYFFFFHFLPYRLTPLNRLLALLNPNSNLNYSKFNLVRSWNFGTKIVLPWWKKNSLVQVSMATNRCTESFLSCGIDHPISAMAAHYLSSQICDLKNSQNC